MLTHLFQKAKLLAFGILVLVLSQALLLAVAATSRVGVTFDFWVTSGFALVFIAVNVFFLYLANRFNWLSWPKEGVKRKDIFWIVLSYPMIFCAAMVGAYIMQVNGQDTTSNQERIMAVMRSLPRLLVFLALVIGAPIAEELLCREVVLRLFVEKYRSYGLVLGALVFATLHTPTDLGSWLLYGLMGAVLSWLRYHTGKIEVSISAHMLWNLVSFILGFMLSAG